MQLKEVIHFLEEKAPPFLQENYDNSGLLTGDPGMEVRGAVVCLDCTESVLDEAISKGANLVVAHHPVIFSGMKRLTGGNYVERTVIRAIRHHIAIYAIHTNLDNTLTGVNRRIAEVLGLQDVRILSPRRGILNKLAVFVPEENADAVRDALFAAGAGAIGAYDECSFNLNGTGTFRPSAAASPHTGQAGVRSAEKEVRIETILPKWKVAAAMAAVRKVHPYEEIAHDIYPLENSAQDCGSGVTGTLPSAMPAPAFLEELKRVMKAGVVRHTAWTGKEVRRIALCGGSGSFLLQDAIDSGADVFVTADLKYHQFFDADGRILIADIGHYESEQYTIDLLVEWLCEKFPTFATHKTGVVTNPINYL
jgi:dinuclear metal center YbgI/SA1388 family protein